MPLQLHDHFSQFAHLIIAEAGNIAQGIGNGFERAFHKAGFGAYKAQSHCFMGNGGHGDLFGGAGNKPLVGCSRAVHDHFAQTPQAVDDSGVGAQVYRMARKSHASGLGPYHFNAAKAHARSVQIIAVLGAVGQGAGRKQAGNHLLEGGQHILAGNAEDTAVLTGKGLHAVLGNGA